MGKYSGVERAAGTGGARGLVVICCGGNRRGKAQGALSKKSIIKYAMGIVVWV
jgi:rhodanese-related sulfurtransferase